MMRLNPFESAASSLSLPILLFALLILAPACEQRPAPSGDAELTGTGQEAGPAPAAASADQTVVMKIDKMTCVHCEENLHRVLSKCEGVSSVKVVIGEAKIQGTDLSLEALRLAVEEAGYPVLEIAEVE